MTDEEKKDNKKKHRKVKIILTTLCCFLVVACTLVYLTYLITHRDNKRNPTVKGDNSSIQLIQKNLIEGFRNTKETGKYSFRMPDEDINQILLNSSSELLYKKHESCYVDSESSSFIVDLKPTLGVKTRVIYTYVDQGVNSSNQHIFKLSDETPTMGKIRYMYGHNVNFKEYLDSIKEESGLTYVIESSNLIISPFKFFEYFPNENIKKFVNGLINTKPECLSIDPNSLFGFDIDFSMFRKNDVPLKDCNETYVDFMSQVRNSLTDEFLESIPSRGSKVACSLEISNINKLISTKFAKKDLEHATSELSSLDVTLSFDDLYVVLNDVSHLTFVLKISISGYPLYFISNLDAPTLPEEMRLTYYLNNKITFNGFTFDENSYFGNVGSSLLLECLSSTFTEGSYIKYVKDNKTLCIDLSTISASIPEFTFYTGSIVPNISMPNGFDVVVTSLL